MPEPLLTVDRLDAFYGDFQALFSVSMTIAAGEIVAVIGANGAGKSTLLAGIAGLMGARRDGSRPATLLSSVLLPAPLAPITASISPAATSSETPESARKSP